ncbi:uncharacterized protein LOC112102759 [Terrapene carolina triunguis]|uniref:uncharacterized protein LOC112102759 n=1 Tax=Terrapene triunguis TaxID=2587831 RepID=UPI000E77E44C|nr:uncharacterized protein LOC112102759 [Terrapene carolina triunguis]
MVLLHLKMLKKCQELGHQTFFVFIGQKHDNPVIPEIKSKENLDAIKDTIESIKLVAIKLKQNMPSSLLHGGSKEAVLTEKTEQVDDNQAGVTQNFLGTDKSSKEKTVETHPNKEPESNISDEQDLPNVSPLTQHKPVVEYEKELQLLNQWYKLDENFDPSVYRLLPISTFYQDIFSKDPVRKQQAQSKWLSSFQKLHKIFQEYAPVALGQETTTTTLLKTVLQHEVDQGFQVQGSPEDHCHCFKRNISDIQYYLSSKQASKYIDIHQLRLVVNTRPYEAHQKFIDSIHARLQHTNIYETSVSWGKDGINPISKRSHACYFERLCSDFQKIVITHFNRSVT